MRQYFTNSHYARLAIALTAALVAAVCSASAQWQFEDSGTRSSLRGIHSAGQGVAWASGTNGVVLRSEDEGYLWQQCAIPPDAEKLDFRGVWGWDANRAIVMASGPGAASRLYETMDGCAHWRLLFTNPDSEGFLDAIAFSNQNQGMLLGDPVNGRFAIWRSNDRGRHWSRDNSPGLAAATRTEGAFAASNSSLTFTPDGKNAYFGTGGTGGPRIFHFHAGQWTSVKLPWPASDSAGIFSIAFRDSKHGVAVGGDYKRPDQSENSAAWTSDGGSIWTTALNLPAGFRSAVALDGASKVWVAAGPNGSDISYDDGKTWKPFDKTGWNALSLPWAVGPDGSIAMLNRSALPGALLK